MSVPIPFCAVVSALVLSACTSMSGLEPQASMRDPTTLAASASIDALHPTVGAWPEAQWWRSFHDTQLDALITEALAGSPTLKIAAARVRKGMALVDAANSVTALQASARGTITEQRFSEHDVYPPPLAGTWDSQNRAALNLSYDFDFWGKNRAALASSVGQAKTAEVEVFAARLMLAGAISHAYVRLQQGYARVDLAELSLKDQQHVLALVRQRYNAGLDSKASVQQVEATLAGMRQQLAAIRAAMSLTRNQLAALVGQGPDRALTLRRPRLMPLPSGMLPAELPARLIGRRPDVVAQRWRVEAAAADISVAKAQFYPDVSLTAFLGLQSIGLSDFLRAGSAVAGFGPALDLPVFDGGRRRANLSARDADYDVAVEQYNQTLIQALQEVLDQLSSLHSLDEQRTQQQVALQRTQDAHQLVLLRYRAGLASYLEVLSADASVLAQQSQTTDLEARQFDAAIDLIKALGGGYETLAKSTAAPAITSVSTSSPLP